MNLKIQKCLFILNASNLALSFLLSGTSNLYRGAFYKAGNLDAYKAGHLAFYKATKAKNRRKTRHWMPIRPRTLKSEWPYSKPSCRL